MPKKGGLARKREKAQVNFAKFVRTPFPQKTTGRLVPIIAVLKVLKRKISKRNYDINLKHINLSKNYNLSKRAVQTKEV